MPSVPAIRLADVPENTADRIVWIDCEMTGLDYRNDLLVEVACVVTDGELNEIGDGFDVVIAAPADRLANMDPFVINMHTESGLLPLIPDGLSVEAAQAGLLAYIQALVPDAGKAPLAGSSVHVDRVFIERDMPLVNAYLHYRIIDVSSIKEVVRRWYPRVYFASPEKTGNHRALGDIRDSIRELRYYRQTVFVDQPGPDTGTAKVAAARVLGSTTD
jgi:oligoribonuclease